MPASPGIGDPPPRGRPRMAIECGRAEEREDDEGFLSDDGREDFHIPLRMGCSEAPSAEVAQTSANRPQRLAQTGSPARSPRGEDGTAAECRQVRSDPPTEESS
jgi:hypothetical protein